jgi:hypothetical protein
MAPQSPSRALLHIGTHKTGTTLIQNTLAANRKLLARHGVIYPEIGRASGHHSLLTRWLTLDPYYHTPVAPRELWQGLARFARPGQTLVLSSEEFSRGFSRRVDFAEVRDFLAPFDQIEVVCFLRDQMSFLQSIYLEIGKKKAGPGFPALIDGAIKNGYAAGLHIDYGALYDQLLEVFSPDQIRFVDYAQARRAPGGILGVMLGLCGTDLAAEALKPASGPETAVANISPDPLATWAAGLVASPEAPAPALIARARSVLDQLFGAGRPSLIYTRAEYRGLAAHIAPRNAAFAARLADRQPGFTLSPPRPDPASLPGPVKPATGPDAGPVQGPDPGDPIWREDIGQTFWVRFARDLYHPNG